MRSGAPILNPYRQLLDELRDAGPGAWMPGPRLQGIRRKLVAAYAWAIPSLEAIDAIRELDVPLVELGAGTGYWAFCLRQAGVDVAAYDANPGAPPHWSVVAPGTPESVFGDSDSPMHSRALFLCWPPLGEPLAERALELYRGGVLIEIGEGPGGNTGTDEFHSQLRREWRLDCELELPRWPDARDSMRIWRR